MVSIYSSSTIRIIVIYIQSDAVFYYGCWPICFCFNPF